MTGTDERQAPALAAAVARVGVMLRYPLVRRILIRVGTSLALLFGLAALLYLLLDAVPADAALREAGLEAPLWQRLPGWLAGTLVGDLGTSPRHAVPAGELLGERLAVTLPLVALAALVGVGLGLGAGFAAALLRPVGIATSVKLRLVAAMPAFWFAMLMVLVLSAWLQWLPPGGFVPWAQSVSGALGSLVLPALALGLPMAVSVAGMARRCLAEAEAAGAMALSRAIGVPRYRALATEAVPVALAPALAMLGAAAVALVAAVVVVENVFYLPGLGRLLFMAALERDVVVLRAALLAFLAIIFAVRLLAGLANDVDEATP